ncbi:alpha-glucosidase [bacterium]|nr:alpha-glucosidase [bacterium]
MNMMQQFLIAVRFVGLRSTLRTLSYSRYRDKVEKRFGVPSKMEKKPPISPSRLEGVKPFHNGAVFSFNDGIQLEVAFLSHSTVRVTWTPGSRPVSYAVGGDETIALLAEVTAMEEKYRLSAGSLEVFVHPDGALIYVSDGVVIRQDAPPVYAAPAWTHQAQLDEDALIYGLGERTRLNLRPGKYALWNQDPGGSYGVEDDPLYVTIPVYFCQQQAGSYLAFYENTFAGQATFGQQAEMQFVGGAIRLFVIAGKLPEALEEYTRLTGKPPLPPIWALGFHQCRWGYATAEEVREVLAGFRKYQLPLGAFHFDIDYMDGFRVFTVDSERFADFEPLCAEMEAEGIKPVVIIDPGVKIDPKYSVYASGMEKKVFCTLPDGKLARGLVWPGWVYFPDFTNPVTREWWGSQYQGLLDAGVAGIWHDMNEPAAFTAFGENTIPRVVRHSMEGREGGHEEAHNVYGLMMDQAGFEGLRKLRPNRRPWLLTRSGWAGVQRYAWKWTGDVESSWSALKMTISTVLGLGISGIPYAGSDIGGFSGNPDAELFTRWFQMSTLMAFFRNHAAAGSARREPWVYGEPYTSILREMLQLRLRLMPYLYTLAYEARRTGAPLARPLFWDQPGKPALWDVDDAYLLGNSVLVAPVVEQGASSRTVQFPSGGWYHFWDDAYYDGDTKKVVDAPLTQIPFFIKEGTVLPLEEEGGLSLHVYLPQEDGEYVSQRYVDVGDGYGDYRVDVYHFKRTGNQILIRTQGEGEYPLEREVQLVLHGGTARQVMTDGEVFPVVANRTSLPPSEFLQFGLQ